MRIETLDCNECGAPLEVPEDVRFVRCGHCGSRLRINRESSAHYTEVLERIEKSTRALENEVRSLRVQNELRALDDAWRAKSEGMMVRGKHGGTSRPSAVGGVIGGLLAGAFGVFWTVMVASNGAPGFFVLFGVVFVVFAIVGGLYSITRAGAYDEAEREYLEARRRLQGRMREDED
jgi:hypothetical protein